jgi:anti-sigma regulatory factor (Ser/Thr protein kinase)
MNVAKQRIVIHSEVDIVSARMAVREYARHCGLCLKDQACISMAASSMATSLGFGERMLSNGGEIVIEYLENQPQRGVRVRCIKRLSENDTKDSIHQVENSRWLVDDIEMHAISSEQVEIVITKWDSLYKG